MGERYEKYMQQIQGEHESSKTNSLELPSTISQRRYREITFPHAIRGRCGAKWKEN